MKRGFNRSKLKEGRGSVSHLVGIPSNDYILKQLCLGTQSELSSCFNKGEGERKRGNMPTGMFPVLYDYVHVTPLSKP